MQRIYRQKSTGDLYVVEHGQHYRQVGLSGTRFLTLKLPQRIIDEATSKEVVVPYVDEAYADFEECHANALVVTAAEFAEGFEEVQGWLACQNSEIQTLLRQYEAECCDHTDLDWVSRTALRYAQTMGDSQVRCLLYVLAEHVQKTLPAKAGEAPGAKAP